MTSPSFVGRTEELEVLKSLLTRARNAAGGALVIRGEPGIGKTALLEAATADLAGMTVIRVDGFEAELALPYAALQRIGSALVDHMPSVPARQRDALLVACGSAEGPPPDRFLVGMGLLGLFAAAGSTRPVVCIIDNTHWLDSESRDVLAFVSRRLQAESAALLFATRDTEESRTQLAGIPTVELSGLDAQSAVRLLSVATAENIDPYAAARIAAATGGHPLALLELTRDLNSGQLGRLSLSPKPAPIGTQLQEHYLAQVRQLAPDVQTWLLIAAAEPSADRNMIATAAATLELPPQSGYDAEQARLVSIADSVTFRHPLVRAAVYGAASGVDRRRVHSALRAAAEQFGLVDIEAWHAAEATEGTDGDVADRLDAAADRAARRGGLVSQARLLMRSAELTPVGGARDDRLLSAARAAADAGAAQLAKDLLAKLDPSRLDPVQRGRLMMIRTEVGLFTVDPELIVRGPADLVAAADLFRNRAPELEQSALLRAFELRSVAELAMVDISLEELGRRLQEGVGTGDEPRSIVLRALAAHILAPYDQAVPVMRTAVTTLDGLEDESLTEFGFVGITLITALFDKRAGSDYLERLATIARNAGALRALDSVLWVRAIFELEQGDPAACGEFMSQVREVRQALGYDAENVVNAGYLAWTGTPREDLEMLADAVKTMGFGGVHTSTISALAVRDIAEGRYSEAYSALLTIVDAPLLQVAYIRYADFVEAAVRSDHDGDAIRIAARITEMAAANGTPLLRGLDQCCQALLASDRDAEFHYLRAIDILDGAHAPAPLGRAHLLFGEWLRRMKRRRDAREHLRIAIAAFEGIEAQPFADRAAAELAATGERTREQHLVAGVQMSPQEAAVAQMAGEGRTNAEIGATLFISTNTVDYHLRKVFGKLGVSSRRQLAERFRTSR